MDDLIQKMIELLEKRELSIEGFEYLLTPEEKSVWNVLKYKKHALNVNEIREAIIDEFINFLNSYSGEEDPKAIYVLSRPALKHIWVGKVNFSKKTINEALDEINDKGINLENPTSREKRIVADILKRKGIVSIPSHKTIERILENFEKMGVVVSRPDVRGKGKKLYSLNPRLAKFVDSSKLVNST